MTNNLNYFCLPFNSLEFTEPLEELLRERNTFMKISEESNNKFWVFITKKLPNKLLSSKSVQKLLKKSVNFTSDSTRFLIVITNDEIFKNWLKLKFPDLFEVNTILPLSELNGFYGSVKDGESNSFLNYSKNLLK